MNFDLQNAQMKFERQQQERKENMRKKKERELKLREEAMKRKQEYEEKQRIKRLEVAAAEETARQLEQALLEAGDGVVFSQVLRPFVISGESDKLTLPASVLEALDDQNATGKGPMFFELEVANDPLVLDFEDAMDGGNSLRTHAGVREFIAEEGTVGVTSHIARTLNLSLSSSERLRVRYVRLPRGTHAKLQPLDVRFTNVHNQKAVLETQLRNHTTLTEGDAFSLFHAGTIFQFKVLELKPEAAVSLIDTDIEVDISLGGGIGPSEENLIVPLELGKDVEGRVQEKEFRYYKFEIPESLGKSVEIGDSSISVKLKLKDSQNGENQSSNLRASDADIYVSSLPISLPTQHSHHYANHDSQREKEILILSDQFRGAGPYFVGIHGFNGTPQYTLKVEVHDKDSGESSGRKLQSFNATGDQQTKVGFLKCSNCKQFVSERTISLHEAYCQRHNFSCPFPGCGVILRKVEGERHVHCNECGLAFEKESLEKHISVTHSLATCECGREFQLEQLVGISSYSPCSQSNFSNFLSLQKQRKHRENECPFRLISCRFCGDFVPAEGESTDLRDKIQGLTLHESRCGSRTSNCDICGKIVPLKEMELHRKAVHEPISDPLIPETKLINSKAAFTTNSEVGTIESSLVQCPVCFKEFPEPLMGGHVGEHFNGNENVREPMTSEVSGGNKFKTTSTVECPICGKFVHSERDLSLHLDEVH